MGKKNRKNKNERSQKMANQNENVINVNTNENVVTTNQEDIMSKSNNVQSMEDLFNAVAEQAKKERKAGTLRMSELKKQLKERDKHIQDIKDQLFIILENVKDNELMELQARQHAELKIKEIKLQYKQVEEEYNMYTVENAEAIADVVVEKTTKFVAPVTRGIAQGVRGIGKSLFGFGKDK